jgi:hypothetical protein
LFLAIAYSEFLLLIIISKTCICSAPIVSNDHRWSLICVYNSKTILVKKKNLIPNIVKYKFGMMKLLNVFAINKQITESGS